jgi:ATP-binding cassette subfamily B protein
MKPSGRAARKSGFRRVRRALSFGFPYRRAVFWIFIVTLLLAGLNAAEPLVLKYIFDNLGTHQPGRVLFIGIGVLIGLSIVRELATAYTNWQTWHARLGIHYTLLEDTVERLHRMPLSLHRNEGVGAIMTRLDRGIQGFISAVTQILFNIFPAIIYLCISVFVMFQLNARLAFIVICFLPLPAVIAAMAGPEQNRRERSLLDQWSKIYSRFNEVLSGIITVRSFSMEDAEKKRFLRDVDAANRLVIRGVGIDTGLGAATNLVVAFARVAAIALGGMFVLEGRITVGTLIAFLGYVGGLFGPVQGLTTVYQTIQKADVSLDEIFSILDIQDHLGDAPDAKEVTHIRGDVRFEKVRFRYEALARPILDGVDVHVEPGRVLAIVGPSGSGKTTMMALLMRFYDPVEGAVLLDGQDLRTLRQRSLRRNIGTVLQDPLLFNDTVRNNIAYGRPDAHLEDVESAARAANAYQFITQLPEGFDTMVGERGSRLSVGERQRVAIARALLKDPPILVLDEATSSLDAESEALVQEALNRLMAGRTTFVIAHRLATVVHADRIIVLKNGRIAESGTHDELMRQRGYYASLVQRQTRGLIHNEGELELTE